MAAVTKELKAAKNALDKARASKVVAATELAALKAAAKRLTAYTKAIAAADRCLINQQRKRKRKKSLSNFTAALITARGMNWTRYLRPYAAWTRHPSVQGRIYSVSQVPGSNSCFG